MPKPIVFIDGDQGTTGLQVRERLAGRQDLCVLSLPPAERKHLARRAEALNACDLALLCLPDGAAREAVALIGNPAVRVIDASSAHRTAPGWTYGLPELSARQAAAIASARRVSNPGCYPTGMLLLVAPLVAAGLLPADLPLVVQATSGYSGQGRAGLQAHERPGQGEGSAIAPPFQVYGLTLQHKHTPEMQQHARLLHPPLFVPSYGHYRQGIVLTIGLHRRLLPPAASARALQAALARHHGAHPTVELRPLAGMHADADAKPCASAGADRPAHAQAHDLAAARLDPRALNGSDRVRLQLFADARDRADGQILLTAVLDNLGKGAAGAAVQNLDLMLGLSPGHTRATAFSPGLP